MSLILKFRYIIYNSLFIHINYYLSFIITNYIQILSFLNLFPKQWQLVLILLIILQNGDYFFWVFPQTFFKYTIIEIRHFYVE